jgi:hypothetical protein
MFRLLQFHVRPSLPLLLYSRLTQSSQRPSSFVVGIGLVSLILQSWYPSSDILDISFLSLAIRGPRSSIPKRASCMRLGRYMSDCGCNMRWVEL